MGGYSMNPLFLRLLILFSKNSTKPPIRLEKRKDEGFIGRHYESIMKILFIILIVLLILLVGTVFILFVLHGASITGTESNMWYYHSGV